MKKKTLIIIIFFLVILSGNSLSGFKIPMLSSKAPYKNPNLPIQTRVEDLLQRMSIEEKVHQLATFFPNGNIRLGIPHLKAGEALHGICLKHGTCFPQAIALASTWDPSLIEKTAEIIALEARALGVHHVYSPMLGVVRDPRWGRTEESYGEDPYLVSRIGVAFINGLQGKGKKRFDINHVLATAKHFVADGQPYAGLNRGPMEASARTLHEVFLPPFRAAVEEARVGCIMPAHHSLNGIPCHAHQELLINILRHRYGFDGLIISDNNDIKALHTEHKIAENLHQAARLALEAGIDMELAIDQPWGPNRAYGPELIQAVKKGSLPIELVDRAVRNVLKAKFRLGLFQQTNNIPPEHDFMVGGDQGMTQFTPVETETGVRRYDSEVTEYFNTLHRLAVPRPGWEKIIYNPEHDRLALEVARKAIILLKNENDLLPLDISKLKTIAVIGPNAAAEVVGGYSTPQLKYYVSVLDGIKNFAQGKAKIIYEEGCSLINFNQANIPAAVSAARRSDVAIVVIGGNELTCKENEDRDNLQLVGHQEELVRQIYATGTPTVVVLLHGRPLAIGWIKEHIPAILDGWYLGQETGTAIAEALFGKINPGGKLPISYPRHVGQIPDYYNVFRWASHRGRYFHSERGPLFPFGHGLSYTQFTYSDLKITSLKRHDVVLAVSLQITNTGARTGDEVIQLYIHDEYASVVRPVRELKRFQRITLKPGETKRVEFSLNSEDFAFYDTQSQGWKVEEGTFQIQIGASSTDIRLQARVEYKKNQWLVLK